MSRFHSGFPGIVPPGFGIDGPRGGCPADWVRRVRCSPKDDTDVGAHFGRAGQELEIDLESELIGQVDRTG